MSTRHIFRESFLGLSVAVVSLVAALALLTQTASAATPAHLVLTRHAAVSSTPGYRCYTYSTSYQSLPFSFGLSGPVCFNGTSVYAPAKPTPFCSHAWWAPNISCSLWGGPGVFYDSKKGALTLWANWFAVESIPYPGLPTGAGVPFHPYARIWVKPNGVSSSSSVL